MDFTNSLEYLTKVNPFNYKKRKYNYLTIEHIEYYKNNDSTFYSEILEPMLKTDIFRSTTGIWIKNESEILPVVNFTKENNLDWYKTGLLHSNRLIKIEGDKVVKGKVSFDFVIYLVFSFFLSLFFGYFVYFFFNCFDVATGSFIIKKINNNRILGYIYFGICLFSFIFPMIQLVTHLTALRIYKNLFKKTTTIKKPV